MKKYLFLLLTLLFSFIPSMAQFMYDGMTFEPINENECRLTKGDKNKAEVIIPAQVTDEYAGKTYTVTSIGDKAFANSRILESVIIPNSVTTIGSHAFRDCRSLTSATMPNSVTTIGDSAFLNCSSLTSVIIPNSVTTIERSTFNGCSSLVSITIPNSVTTIDRYAFSGCSSLASVTIHNLVTTIGGSAFSGCSSLTSVTIPNSVTTIGDFAFRECGNLTSITVDSGNPNFASQDGVLYSKDLKTLITCPGGRTGELGIPNSVTTIEGSAFYDCSGLVSLTIPNSVTTIGNSAFRGCSSLASLTIPNSVTTIGEFTFYGCSSLVSLTIPNSVTTIDRYAFSECSSLVSVTIPNSVITIDIYAFSGCSGLTSFIIPDSVTEIGGGVFEGCNGLVKCAYPNTIKSPFNDTVFKVVYSPATNVIEDGFIFDKDKTRILYVPTDITDDYRIPATIREIGSYAFGACYNITSLSIPTNVTRIADNVFNKCENLKSLSIDDGTSEITLAHDFLNECYLERIHLGRDWTYGQFDDEALTGQSTLGKELKEVTLGNNVTRIPKAAFYNCAALTSVALPNGVTAIYDRAFEGCVSLLSLSIPETVNTIETYAFKGCISLASMTIPEPVNTIGNYAFDGCTSLTSVTIPESVNTIGTAAFNGCTSLKSITIPESVKTIGTYVFYECGSLTSADIKAKVTSIPIGTFYFCSALNTVTIPDGVTTIGEKAFYGCEALNSVELPASVSEIQSEAFTHLGELILMSESAPSVVWGNKVPLSFNKGCAVNISEGSFASYMMEGWWNRIDNLKEIGCDGKVAYFIDDNFRYRINPADHTAFVYDSFTYDTYLMIPEFVVGGSSVNNERFDVVGISFNGLNESGAQTVRFPSKSKLRYIGGKAFPATLQTIKLPETVQQIGNNAFQHSAIETIVIPNSVTRLGEYAFDGCSKLQNVTLGSGIEEIQRNLFSGTAIKIIVLPPAVKTIAESAFENANDLKQIVMGHSVSSIGSMVFSSEAPKVWITAPNPPEAPNDAFASYTGSLFTQGKEAKTAYQDAYNCWWRFSNISTMTEPTSFGVNGYNKIAGSAGDTFQLSAWFNPGSVSLPFVFWRSTNPDIATVDTDGVVTLRTDVTAGMMTDKGCRIIAETLYNDIPAVEIVVTEENESGIENVEADAEITTDGPVEVYNLNGLKVGDSTENLVPAIYIVRQGNQVRKIAVN